MPWKRSDLEMERMRFVTLAKEGLYEMTELCERFGVSRQTGYTLLERYEAHGLDGLKDRSHAPHTCPQRIGQEMRALLLDARRGHPHWGPRKILGWLRPRHPELVLPAASTVGDLYKREKLVKTRRRTRNWSHPGRDWVRVGEPNDLWTMDFKGDFRMGDGRRCYPLTIADAHTRFLLVCHGLDSTAHAGTRAVVERVFREYGLPKVIRTDNGGPFATKAIAGLSRLNVWWTQLGIGHDRIAPGHPEQNGAHERMHQTLKQETAFPPAANGPAQQDRFDVFRAEFDFERPHEALGMRTPGSLYAPSPRELPERVPGPEYPAHCIVRQVRANGILYFGDRSIFLSELLVGQHVALEEIADGIWSIYFYKLLLARFSAVDGRLHG
jgi:putative transposase